MLENKSFNILSVLNQRPNALAIIKGSNKYPKAGGNVRLYQTRAGVLVSAEITGLPKESGFFGFHIHDGRVCSGNSGDPFANALTHYNPYDRPHPYHAGDLPPLLGNSGHAASVFLTDRFSVNEVIGKTFIVHSSPDDLTTQPSGNSGEKLACGVIKRA